MEPLVSTAWLAEPLGGPGLRVLECTTILRPGGPGGYQVVSGRDDWAVGHIPGSGFADLATDLSDPDSRLRFMLPAADRFAAAMSALGVGDGVRVVLYDRARSMWAARVWWMLRAFGFDDAAVLDGGWAAWTGEGRPVTADVGPFDPATFVPRVRPGLFVGREEVLAAIGATGTCLVDALPAASFSGEARVYARPGHIPTARNVSAAGLVEDTTHRYRSLEDLRTSFAEVLGRDRVITYCGGGIAASSDAFVLHLLGHRDVAVYDGSLSEWSADPSLPMTVES
jgi:thiosulfate/3-mercaptopyruvate sulfurtransferase